MKKLNLFLITGIIALNLFSCDNVFSQKITRGPDIGEIYFMGPTTTILNGAIYRSTDFRNRRLIATQRAVGVVGNLDGVEGRAQRVVDHHAPGQAIA